MNYDIFLEKLKEANLSKDEFEGLTKVKHGTLKGWAIIRQGKKTPEWVDSWLQLYIDITKILLYTYNMQTKR